MDDLIFNLDDMNVQEEPATFIQDNNPNPEPDTVDENKPDPNPDQQEETPSVEIPETVNENEGQEEEVTEEIPSEETPSSEASNSSQSTLYALVKHLKDEGVLFLDEELEKVESLEDVKAAIVKSNNKAKYSNLSDTQKRYLDALENGVPVKEYETLEKEISTFEKINKEAISKDAQLQYELIAIDFMNQGIDQEKAMKLAQLSVKADGDESVNEAEKALESIIKFKTDKFKKLIEEKKEKTDIDLKTIRESIDKKDKILTMPVNDNIKNKLFDYMTTKVASDDNGLPLNKLQKFQKDNPVEANILLNYLFMVTNEGKDLGLIKTNTTSSASKELEKKLKQLNFDKNGSLIIPDEMISNTNNKNKNNLTINI